MELNAKETAVNSLLKELAIRDAAQLVRDSLITEILCRISDFSEEVRHFEEKYNLRFHLFQKEYEAGEENFDKYDDLMAWEFAWQGKQYWEEKLKDAKSVL